METLKGYIDRISYQNEENGYTVMTLTSDTGSITCVGQARGFSAGETVELEGDHTEHATYGRQFKFSSIRAVAPSDKISVLRYLGSGAIKGLGEKLAAKIVEKFGDDTLRILEEEPERLAEVKGISARMAREISDQLADRREQRRALLFLQQFGITAVLADRIYGIYGDTIYSVMRNNPYKLAEDVPAVGFKRADAIALKAGIPADSQYRIRCGAVYILSNMTMEGHCYLPREELKSRTAELLECSADAVEEQLPDLAMEGKVVTESGRVYLSTYYRAELYVARRLKEIRDDMTGEEVTISPEDDLSGISLDPLQREAVQKSLSNGVFILSGGPGTGKTTTINAIISRLEERDETVLLAAPTGRAAKRMSETTGRDAVTIHRLLEIGGEQGENTEHYFYGRNEDEPLEADTVIIDEMSMVDLHLMKALLAAIPAGCRLIMVGDVDQLPSVGPGQVLRDILESGAFPSVRLKHIFRQAGESHIVSYAHMINEGKHPDLSIKYPDFFLLEKGDSVTVCNYICSLIEDVIPRKLQLERNSIQVLTPMRRGNLGVEALNQILQERLNPSSPEKTEYTFGDTVFREGDRVMQIKNDYQLDWEIKGSFGITVESGKGVFNGDTGTIRHINTYLKLMEVVFDDGREVYYGFQQLDELESAYAVTIHKSQGSEYDVVILPLLSGPKMLMNRNLLYTAVTRAKQCVIIIGSAETVYRMTDNDNEQSRYTGLKEKICGL